MKQLIFLLLSVLLKEGAALLDHNVMQLAYMDEIQELRRNFSQPIPIIDIESQVKFFLYTRRQSDAELLRPYDDFLLKSSRFSMETPTKIVIHGYFGKASRSMIQDIKNRFLETQDVNVIAVDWGEIAIDINYYTVARRTPDVGSYVAQLLDFLVSMGHNPDSFHLIGHSLGAHVAGFAGKLATSGKPARITGLDPAKPGFVSVEAAKRLDSSDAHLVDCIHTCGGLLGLHEPICDADFYPNGGKHAQPGCFYMDFGKCSHRRSHEYFAESILPDHKFPALQCPGVTDDPVDCVESPHAMGNFLKPNIRGKFYVQTNSRYPYAPINQ